MSESKYIKPKQKKTGTTSPRSIEDLNAAYVEATAAAGEIQYKIINLQHNLTLTNQRISAIHAEANQRQELESKNKPASATPEAASVQE